jgi:CheY-like chemotaxis protein/nitrogen-specific signal transduction histidine kinase
VTGFYVLVTDLTQRRQTEQALRDADRRKNEFLATLAHELRNPLAPIRNSINILRMSGTADGGTDRIHEMMERQVEHMVRLVDDLLELSRITSGKIDLSIDRIEIAAIVRHGMETSKPLIEAGNHRLSVTLPAEPLTVEGDMVRLSQVVANLLNNAAKYTPPGGQIAVSVRREGQWIALAVRDNGIGIAPAALPNIFEMFVQVDQDHKRTQGGLGIGLALVKRLVEMHGGAVQAASAGEGKGSEFTVRLPLASRQLPQPEQLPEKSRNAPTRRRVLVVDDNQDAASSLGMLLGLLGSEVQTANDGRSALALVERYRPDVVLLDLGMPGMSGYEVAQRVRELPQFREVKLIALTGWGQEDDRRRTREAGFDHHLVKPVNLEALQVLLSEV